MPNGNYGMCFLSNIFKSNQHFSCKNIEENLFFDFNDNIRICPKHEFGIIRKKFDGLWIDYSSVKSKRCDCLNKADENCRNCEFCRTGKPKIKNVLSELHIGHWKNCYINCSYCKNIKTDNLTEAEHYDITSVVEQLADEKIINRNTKIIFECGDATLHPEFDKLLYYFINFESKYIEIHSPALTYRDSIADGIGRNIVNLVVNFDCGNKNVYKFIKNSEDMTTPVENIKRYMKFQLPGEKKIISLFTLIKDANDGKKEVTDWFIFSSDLGIKKMIFTIEDNFFNEIKNDTPEYIKEIIVFIREIANLNNLELQFCDKVKMLYSAIDNPKKYLAV